MSVLSEENIQNIYIGKWKIDFLNNEISIQSLYSYLYRAQEEIVKILVIKFKKNDKRLRNFVKDYNVFMGFKLTKIKVDTPEIFDEHATWISRHIRNKWSVNFILRETWELHYFFEKEKDALKFSNR